MIALGVALLISCLYVLSWELLNEYQSTPAWLFFGAILGIPVSFGAMALA